jgi:hypothetical protein
MVWSLHVITDTAMIPAVVAATGLTLVDTGFVPCL